MSSFAAPLNGLRSRGLSRCLADRGLCLQHEDADANLDLSENLPPGWPESGTMPVRIGAKIEAAKAEARRTGKSRTIEVELGTLEVPRLYELHLSPDIDEAGEIAGLFIVVADVTEQRQRERAMADLLREVSHRSKNLLAIVQSIAMQTAHYSGDTYEFLEKLRGRLQALASTQDLVTESNWRGTLFHRLVAGQLSRLGKGVAEGLTISGSNPMLGPNAALYIGLAIHELAANALAHGGLGGEGSHIVVTARVGEGGGKGRLLTIDWEEVAAVNDNGVPRFGTLVLERIVPLSVGGSAAYRVGPDHVSYQLSVPAEQFEA